MLLQSSQIILFIRLWTWRPWIFQAPSTVLGIQRAIKVNSAYLNPIFDSGLESGRNVLGENACANTCDRASLENLNQVSVVCYNSNHVQLLDKPNKAVPIAGQYCTVRCDKGRIGMDKHKCGTNGQWIAETNFCGEKIIYQKWQNIKTGTCFGDNKLTYMPLLSFLSITCS